MKTVLLAWNSIREAKGSLADALLLQQADNRIVFGIDTGDDEHIAGAEISVHLARHGVKAETRHKVRSEISPGEDLLSSIADFGGDLLVVGTCNHHRMRELLPGGVTRDILRSMTVPVLMSQ